MKKPFSLRKNTDKNKKSYSPEELTLVEYPNENEPTVSDLAKEYLKQLDD